MLEKLIRYVFAMVTEGKMKALKAEIDSDPEVIRMYENEAKVAAQAAEATASSIAVSKSVEKFVAETRAEVAMIKNGTFVFPDESPSVLEPTNVPADWPRERVLAELERNKVEQRRLEPELQHEEDAYDAWLDELSPPRSFDMTKLEHLRGEDLRIREETSQLLRRYMQIRFDK